MSLNAITLSAMSGLQTAQTGLRTVSDNIANIDTPGYVRKILQQSSLATNGVGAGVKVEQITLAVDRFLQSAGIRAASDAGAAGAASALWDQAQGLFGDPSEDTSFFSTLDQVFSAFSVLNDAPTSSAARAGALAQVSELFNQSETISDQLQNLRDQADAQIRSDVERVNQLLEQINSLNAEISRGRIMNSDATGPQNKQLQLIDELSTLMDIKVTPLDQGGYTVRASDGMMLAGEGAASFSYDGSGARGELSVTSPAGRTQLFGARLTSGEIKGYLDLRNEDLPAVSGQLAELVSQTANELNRVHNEYTAVPPANELVGRQTGLDLPTAIGGFSGQTTVAILDGDGVLQRKVDIDFTAGTMSVNGGPASAFTPASFLADLNTSLGGFGSASFTNGQLGIKASTGNGVAVADPDTAPSGKAGQSFASFFGLNDLVRSTGFTQYDTGLKATDPHGFTPGSQITLRITGADGARITDVAVTVPAAPTMADLINSLNATPGGVGLWGAFSLDANGQLAFAPPSGSGTTLTVVQDSTARGPGGPTMTSLFGLDQQTRANRANSYSIRPDILQDPTKLSLAKLDLSVAVGAAAVAKGDVRGADALNRAGQTSVTFDAAGGFGKLTQSISDYAAGLSGQIARKAAAAEAAKETAQAVATEANTRRSSVEGVNLDQELIQLTTYQQAYNAAARMIQATKEMFDVLFNMTN